MKTKHSIIGSIIMGIVALGLFTFPSPAANNGGNQPIPVLYGDQNSTIDVKVPIIAMSADNVGTMHIELTYDPDVLIPVSVTNGTITEDSTIEYNLEIPGRAIWEMTNPEGVDGQGSLASIAFHVVGDTDMISPLKLDNLNAWNYLTNSRILPTTLDGSYRVSDQSIEPPVVVFPQ